MYTPAHTHAMYTPAHTHTRARALLSHLYTGKGATYNSTALPAVVCAIVL